MNSLLSLGVSGNIRHSVGVAWHKVGNGTKATGVKNRPFAGCAQEHQKYLIRKVALIPNAIPKTFYKSFL
jgi:hypothetical protein